MIVQGGQGEANCSFRANLVIPIWLKRLGVLVKRVEGAMTSS